MGILFVSTLLFSCIKTTDYEAEEQDKIDKFIAGKNFEKKDVGTYLSFVENNTSTDADAPRDGDKIIVSFTGTYTNGTFLETTDSLTGTIVYPNRKYVYGPKKLEVGTLMYGFDTTIKFFSPGDTGIMVIPSYMAFYNYEPVVYNVRLLDVVENDSLYEANKLSEFLIANSFNPDNQFENCPGIYFKTSSGVLSGNPVGSSFDSVSINITARYAETYYSNNLGRRFYPLLDDPINITRKFESSYNFPLRPAIDSAIKRMEIGETIEIATTPKWAYGNDGYYDTYYQALLVQENIPVYYSIELIDAW